MDEKTWKELKGKELYKAGYYNKRVTDEMRREAWGKLDGEWLY